YSTSEDSDEEDPNEDFGLEQLFQQPPPEEEPAPIQEPFLPNIQELHPPDQVANNMAGIGALTHIPVFDGTQNLQEWIDAIRSNVALLRMGEVAMRTYV